MGKDGSQRTRGRQAVKTGTIEKYERIEKLIYGIWLLLLGIVLVVCSLERSPVLIGGTVRTLCFGLLGMLAVLPLLLLICAGFLPDTGTAVLNPPGKEKDSFDRQKKVPDRSALLRGRLLQFAAFAIAAVLYWVYCFRLSRLISANSTKDALVAGGLLCAAAVFSGGFSADRAD